MSSLFVYFEKQEERGKRQEARSKKQDIMVSAKEKIMISAH